MLISFIVLVIILILLCILLNYLLINNINRYILLILLAPGVIIHELSHAVGCLLVGAKIKEIKFFSPKGDTLGHVTHSKSKIPIIGQFVISIAPLIGCGLVLYLLAVLMNFPTDYNYSLDVLDKEAFNDFFDIIKDGFYIIKDADFKNWETWLFLYFALSLSASISPSSKDFLNMLPSIIFLGIILYLIYKLTESISKLNFITNLFYPIISFGILMVIIALLITFPIVFIIKIFK